MNNNIYKIYAIERFVDNCLEGCQGDVKYDGFFAPIKTIPTEIAIIISNRNRGDTWLYRGFSDFRLPNGKIECGIQHGRMKTEWGFDEVEYGYTIYAIKNGECTIGHLFKSVSKRGNDITKYSNIYAFETHQRSNVIYTGYANDPNLYIDEKYYNMEKIFTNGRHVDIRYGTVKFINDMRRKIFHIDGHIEK